LHDVTVLVIFVEGEKAALALTALAERAGRKWLVVGLGGCWGWRAKTGSERTADGSRFPVTGPHPDFDMLALKGRVAMIVFDSNAASNPMEAAPRARREGPNCAVSQIPEVNSPDDYLAAFGDEAMLRILDGATAPGGPCVNPWDAARDITSFLNERDTDMEVLERRVLEREAVTEAFSTRGIGKSEWGTELAVRQAKAGRRVPYLDRAAELARRRDLETAYNRIP